MKRQKILLTVLTTIGLTLMAAPVLAKGFSLKDAGISLWVFIVIGAVIILLQLIPAAILFFSFIGTISALAFKRNKVAETDGIKEEMQVRVSGHDPLTVEK